MVCSLFLFACRAARTDFRPDNTYDPSQLKEDLQILSSALETHHPGLYWYQSTDHWQKQLEVAKNALDRPLTEPEFRKILRPLVSSVRCGHTSIRPSKQWERYSDTARIDNDPICSWLVAKCYQVVGKRFGVDADAASPDDIWDYVSTNKNYRCMRALREVF